MYNFTIYLTTDCNFRCSYCYEDYNCHCQLNQKSLIETLEFIFHYANDKKILLNFLGGEPLLKKELIFEAIGYIKMYYPNRPVKYYITTNCSLIDDDFVNFMKKNLFNVRLSFDGNESTHNLNRMAVDGESCYEKILENILKVKNSGLPFSVRMTITQNTIPYMYENVRFLHEQGLSNIGMIMDVYLNLSEEMKREFETQVEKITEYYIQQYDNNSKIGIDQFDGKLISFLCNFGNGFCMCDAGISNFKIMPNGDIYPCGFLTNDNRFIIGSIYNGIDIQKSKKITRSLFDKHDSKCINCQIKSFCHGMKCGYMNFIYTGKINIPSNSECYCEQIFYKAMMSIVDHYLLQSKEKLRNTLGWYMSYIQKDKLLLGEYGLKVEARLKNEE